MNKRVALSNEAYPLPPLDPALLAHTYEERLAYLRAEIQKGEDSPLSIFNDQTIEDIKLRGKNQLKALKTQK